MGKEVKAKPAPTLEQICDRAAEISHELNLALRAYFGQDDGLAKPSANLGKVIKEALKDGVYPLDPKASWERWKEMRLAEGWKFDPAYNKEKKTHPNLVIDYSSLPESERIKDYTFWAAVNAVIKAAEKEAK